MGEVQEKIWILSPVDQFLEDYLGLPRTKDIVDVLPLPKKVLTDILGLPSPASITHEVVTKVSSAIESKLPR